MSGKGRGPGLALAGALLVLGAYGLGRHQGAAGVGGEARPPAPRTARECPDEKEEAAHVCGLPPPAPRPAPAAAEVEGTRKELDRLREAARAGGEGRPSVLNALQEFLIAALGEGRLSPAEFVEMFRSETDAAALDVLQGVLALQPEAAEAPGVKDAFLRIARADGLLARRQAAIAFLGTAWDRDGRVLDALVELARAEEAAEIRLSALGALGSYAVKNEDRSAAVAAALLDVAARPAPDEIRQQAIASLDVRSADEATVRRLAGFLADASPDVRGSAAGKLGEAPPERRAEALAALEAALGREGDPVLRRALLDNLVRCGRGEAAGALERLAARTPDLKADAEEYLAVVRAGVADWEEILERKERLEARRTGR
jgi:hypothetical protein